MWTRSRRRRAFAISAITALICGVLSLMTAPAAGADPSTLPYTFDCGQELQHACPMGSEFWGSILGASRSGSTGTATSGATAA